MSHAIYRKPARYRKPAWGTPVRVFVLACLLGGVVFALAAAPVFALSPERHYEMVSPPFKAGYGVFELEAAALDGERVAFFSVGAFAGTAGAEAYPGYVASRGSSGWSTRSVIAPQAMASEALEYDFSPDLGSVMVLGEPGVDNGQARVESVESQFLFHDTSSPDSEGFWHVIGAPIQSRAFNVTPEGASQDFCHVVFGHASELLPGVGGNQLYDLSRGCGGEAQLRSVALDNQGEPFAPGCLVTLGQGSEYYSFNGVAADGEEIFFDTNRDAVKSACTGSKQVFVRLGGSRTLEVSRPLDVSQPFGGCGDGGSPGEVPGEVPCPGPVRAAALFAGANDAGTRVFFTTTASLVTGDLDSGNDVYMATIGCPVEDEGCGVGEREVTSLTQVSHAAVSGEAADVVSVVKVAPDGSRVYFVAQGALIEGANPQGLAPVKGADNLYVYDAVSGRVSFVADLCSGPLASGEGEDPRCPASLETGTGRHNDTAIWALPTEREVQMAGPDARFLLFSSFGRLTPDDTDSARDVYRYDAATGMLTRVSVGEGGADASGNDDRFDATISPSHSVGRVYQELEMGERAISEDGSRVVFSSVGPLAGGASNHLSNVYEWHEGGVSLISSGSAEQPDKEAVISPSGRDVFFVTSAKLLPQDTDEAPDIYDARIGEGLPVAAAQREPCSSDACQGPLTNPAPLLVPGSVSQAPGEELAPPAAVPAGKAVAKAKSKVVRCRKGFVVRGHTCRRRVRVKAKRARVHGGGGRVVGR